MRNVLRPFYLYMPYFNINAEACAPAGLTYYAKTCSITSLFIADK